MGAGVIGSHPISEHLAAISVGVVDGEALLDLPYVEDSRADVDMNVVMCGDGRMVEVQGTAEHEPFDRKQLDELLDLATVGISEIVELQRQMVSAPPSPRSFPAR